jgi:hypothetical protein
MAELTVNLSNSAQQVKTFQIFCKPTPPSDPVLSHLNPIQLPIPFSSRSIIMSSSQVVSCSRTGIFCAFFINTMRAMDPSHLDLLNCKKITVFKHPGSLKREKQLFSHGSWKHHFSFCVFVPYIFMCAALLVG